MDFQNHISADEFGNLILIAQVADRLGVLPVDSEKMPQNTYIYLRSWSIERNEVELVVKSGAQTRSEHINLRDIPWLSQLINSKNLVHNNGGAQILAP